MLKKPAQHDTIQREEKYRQLVGLRDGRRTAILYAEGVLMYRQAVWSYSLFKQKISKSTRVTIIH